MALSAHIEELESRHKSLDEEIRRIHLSPSVEELKIVELKKKKLELRDRINALKMQMAS